jgi:hypothetical protein
MSSVDNTLVSFLYNHGIIPSWGPADRMKIALIGERSKTKHKGSLAHKIHKKFRLSLRKISVFTEDNKFRACDGKRYDLLIGTRPCEADKLILKAAERYNKRFVLIPCTCGGYGPRVLSLIRNYPVITDCQTYSQKFIGHKGNISYSRIAWIILFNRRPD